MFAPCSTFFRNLCSPECFSTENGVEDLQYPSTYGEQGSGGRDTLSPSFMIVEYGESQFWEIEWI